MVCVLLGAQADWEGAKKLLASASFVRELQSVDKDAVDAKALRRLQKYQADPELTEERMAQVSKAGAALLQWVTALLEYSRVSKLVAPKKERLEELSAALVEREAQVAAKRAQLQGVQDALAALQSELARAQEEKAELVARTELTAARLERAEKLLGGLGGEETRWKAEAERLQSQQSFVVGDALLATAAVAYLGPFTGEFRRRVLDMWKHTVQRAGEGGDPSPLLLSPDFSLQSTLGVAHEVRMWLSNGLPSDAASIDSAVCAKRCLRTPLCIDPQEQAARWLKAEFRQRLLLSRPSAKDFLRVLELALKTGSPLLVEGVGERLEASLDPVLTRASYARGAGRYVQLGVGEVEWSDKFRLFLTTRLSNPHYPPEVQLKVTLLNFHATRSGLEEQLLGEVVRRERPDVEERTHKLAAMLAKDRRQLVELEERTLQLLAGSEADLLDNQALVDSLEESRFTAHVIADRVKDNGATQAEMGRLREQYRSVAVRGSLLFFLTQHLAVLDPLYQHSLHSFLRLFHRGLATAPQAEQLVDRLCFLLSNLTLLVFSAVQRGLFERHRLAFAFSLAAAVEREEGKVSAQQWRTFVSPEAALCDSQPARAAKGKDSTRPAAEAPNPFASSSAPLLSDAEWRWLCAAERLLPSFQGLAAEMVAASPLHFAWAEWLSSDSPSQARLPSLWSERLSPFDALLLVRGLRSSHLPSACAQFVAAVLGPEFSSAAPASLEELLLSSDCRTPTLFLLAPSADPTTLLQRLAKERRRSLTTLSLGQGQGEAAAALLQQAQAKGEWLCLSNLHLGRSWLPTLEERVEALSEAEEGPGGGGGSRVHPDFRLFLSCASCSFVPPALLQRSAKVSTEAAAGLRSRLLRCYLQTLSAADLDAEEAEAESSKRPFVEASDGEAVASSPSTASSAAPLASLSPGRVASPSLSSALPRLLFGLAFFHAAVQERRAFGPIGFARNRALDWTDGDLEAAAQSLKALTREARKAQRPLPLDGLRHLVGEVHYGGRVTDDGDRRLLSALLARCLPPSILEPAFTFDDSGLYSVPPDASLASVVAHIEALPSTAAPEVLGLHSNAGLCVAREESRRVMADLRRLQLRDEGGEEDAGTAGQAAQTAAFEEAVRAKAQALLDALPLLLSRDGAADGLFTATSQGQLPPLSLCLLREVERFNRLLSCVRSSLQDLLRGLRGELSFSGQMEDVASSLAANAVPRLWSAAAYPSLASLERWATDLASRVAFFARWLKEGPPRDFRLSAFFAPQAFLTAALQRHARNTREAIDALHFRVSVADEGEEGLRGGGEVEEGGVRIRGLHCEGGRWNAERGVLDDCVEGELLSPMPPLLFQPSSASSAAAASTPSSLSLASCPLFRTRAREGDLSTTGESTNFLLSIGLPSERPQSFWTLRGAALFVQPD